MVAILSTADKNANISLSGGDLIATDDGDTLDHVGRGDTATTLVGSAEARYWEITVTNLTTQFSVGVCNSSNTFGDSSYLGGQAHGFGWYPDGSIYNSGSGVASAGAYAEGDILGVAVIGGDRVWFSVNGVFTGNPVAATGGVDISALGDLFPAYGLQSGGVATFNFGATALSNAPPIGFTTFDSEAGGPGVIVGPGTIEIVGSTLIVVGASDSITVVPGSADFSGAVLDLDAPVGAVEVVPGFINLAGSTLSISESATGAIAVGPGSIELTGASLAVAGNFEAVFVVAGIAEFVGAAVELVEEGGVGAVVVVAGEAIIEGATLTISAASDSPVDVVPGLAVVVGATLTILAESADPIDVVPGSVAVVGATMMVLGLHRTTRPMSPEMEAALEADIIYPIYFFEIGFNSGFLRLWTGLGDRDWDGKTWAGVGWILGMSETEESSETKATNFVIGLPANAAIIAIALAEFRKNKPATIWQGLLSDEGVLLDDPLVLAKGLTDISELDIETGKPVVRISCETRFADLERARVRRYTIEDHQIDWPEDLFFNQVGSLTDRILTWGNTGNGD